MNLTFSVRPEDLQPLATAIANAILAAQSAASKPAPVSEPKLLTVADVAGKLKVCTAQVRKLIANGHLPGINTNTGGNSLRAAWRVSSSDVDEYIKRRRQWN
ncbi:helix-turn-helix domain-containing protein [Hymenobacter sp. BT18]|uniref:helix-turn-helix domain-containing protein n=1 Tax=Hymenobacter sp. BT18 TaxID=2835648 RepID=UPI00143ED28C|nr:helix-turn-helix domain-containing protein [Hymenobacter sp. BT18]QIX62881.1 helix-turn-helix domain-containing protein [Hymenobacter sp. BT18]